MKLLFLILTILTFQNKTQDLKLWDPNSKIAWSDFKGTVPENRMFKKAVTSSSISIKSNFYKGEVPKYIVKSYFDKNNSWTITNSKEHLIHERLHFEITELYSRLIRKKMDSLSKRLEKNIDCYKKEYKKILNEHANAQIEYDRRSYSSDLKQKEWIIRVSKELDELKEYKYITEN